MVLLLFFITSFTRPICNAVDTEVCFTFSTLIDTGQAYEFLTAMTRTPAVQAACQIANAAAARTHLAEVATAVFTGIAIWRSDRPLAVIAGSTFPVIQSDVRTVGIVGVEDVGDQSEKVTQAALL